MARETNISIIKEHLILCEGKDAEQFLIKYLNSAALSENNFFSNDIQVMDFGGNEDLINYLSLLKNMEGFSEVKSLLIIRDAERDAEGSQKSIINALTKAGFSAPRAPHMWENDSIKTGFLLFPTCDEQVTEGTLEDLCLSILAENSVELILAEVDSFLEHLSETHGRGFPRKFKNKLHTYFSVTDKYVSLKIGEAAKAGAFDWNNRKLLPLKEFIGELPE